MPEQTYDDSCKTIQDVSDQLPYVLSDIEEALYHQQSWIPEFEKVIKKKGSEKLNKEFQKFKQNFENLRYASDEFADLSWQLEDEAEEEGERS